MNHRTLIPTRWLTIACVSCVIWAHGCERSGDSSSTPPIEPPTAPTQFTEDDFTKLVDTVETVRDREFDTPPKLEKVDALNARRAGSDAYTRDRSVLERALFGLDARPDLPTVSESEIAAYDSRTHTIEYVESTSKSALERALVFAIVDALNTRAFAAFPDADSWDQALGQAAARRGDAALVWTTLEAKDTRLDLARLAQRPEAATQLENVRERFQSRTSNLDPQQSLRRHEDAFVVREGFAFSAALWRSGGWSGAELARVTAPSSAAYIVRPDRWLDGEDLGSWTFSELGGPEANPWELRKEGRVGPAVLALWMGRHVDQARARSLFSSWQSDAYQFLERDDDWWFEWVSFWRTPSDATQVAGALNAVFNRENNARYEVIESGATVSVVGTSAQKPEVDLTSRAGTNAGMTPRYTAGTSSLLEFVPSALDHYTSGLQRARLDTDAFEWSDPAAMLELDLELIKDWELQKTDDSSARWIARKGDTTILMTTTLIDPLKPAFESTEFADQVAENFARSVDDASHEIKRIDRPVDQAISVVVTGTFEDQKTAIEARIFRVSETLVTFSIKGPPESVEDHRETFRKLSDRIVVEHEDTEDPTDANGIVEFEVEEE